MAETGGEGESPVNTHARLDALLSRIIQEPEKREEISREIERDFTQRAAVLVLDMSGFSRTTQLHGIVVFLMMIHQMRLLAAPTIQACAGKLVKAEADNLYCLFDTVDDAVKASREIITRLHGEIVRAMHRADVKKLLATDGVEPVGNSPEEFGAYIKAEIAHWAPVIKAAGAKVD